MNKAFAQCRRSHSRTHAPSKQTKPPGTNGYRTHTYSMHNGALIRRNKQCNPAAWDGNQSGGQDAK